MNVILIKQMDSLETERNTPAPVLLNLISYILFLWRILHYEVCNKKNYNSNKLQSYLANCAKYSLYLEQWNKNYFISIHSLSI